MDIPSKNGPPKILQLSHGKIIPAYSSAYALRCRRYLDLFPEREILSVGGLIFKDKHENAASEYRSLIMTVMAVLKGERSLEIFLSMGKYLRKKYLRVLKNKIDGSQIIIFEGPWQYPLVRELLTDKIVIYDAHNVESALRKGNRWEEYTSDIERELAKRAELIITVSDEDRKSFSELFNTASDMIATIPEGYELPEGTWQGLSSEIVFIGSAYGPNIEAANEVLKVAESLPEFTFKIIGTVCSSLPRKRPSNVRLLGLLDKKNKEREICSSFLALNPMKVGSGRNLKMNDYISHGVPIITTEVGARGFDEEIKKTFFIVGCDEISNKIMDISFQHNELIEISNKMIAYAKANSYENTKLESYKAVMTVFGHRNKLL